jgi:hypothetical protein
MARMMPTGGQIEFVLRDRGAPLCPGASGVNVKD